MTISTTDSNQQFVGDDILTVFSWTYKTLDEGDIDVYLDGIVQVSGFTVLLNGDQDSSPGGDVTFDVAPADGENVNIVRSVPQTQLVDYVPFDAFPAETHEGALDKLTMLAQDIQELLERSPVPPPDSVPGDALVTGNLTVQGTTALEDDVTFGGDASGANAPTNVAHFTRKDYVDGIIEAGSLMLFQQTAAPTGWTKGVTHDDKALRVVTGAAGSAGTSPFTTVFALQAVDGHTLVESEMPAHTHELTFSSVFPQGDDEGASGKISAVNTDTLSTGGDGSHAHNIEMRVQYVDVIIASKDA